MKLFLDTADIEEIKTVNSWGVLDGVTTNPTLFAKTSGMTSADTGPFVIPQISCSTSS